MALVLDLLARAGEPLSALVDSLPSYAMAKTKFPIAGLAVSDVLDRIRSAHPEAEATTIDGLRLDWPDRWVHVRSSNTEPIVRVIAEARDESEARELAESVGTLVRRASP
jgi:phosphomannomutase